MKLTNRFICGPGGGKSTSLMNVVEEKAKKGLEIDDLLFVSFTRSQIEDIQERMKKIYPDASDNEIKKSVKTFHSAVLSILLQQKKLFLSNSPDYPGYRIITETKKDAYHYIQFSKANKMFYDTNTSIYDLESEEEGFKNMPEGNTFFRINSYITEMGWNSDKWLEALVRIGANQSVKYNKELFDKWRDYKLENMILEHGDYTIMCIKWNVVPNKRKLFIIDETQDLSPSQFRVYKMWYDANAFDEIYIAGDPNQSIYSFRGANPYFLISEPCNDMIERPVSYRCPTNIIKFADNILGSSSNVIPKDAPGEVTVNDRMKMPAILSFVERMQQKHGKVMVISRYNTDVLEIHNALNSGSIPHTSFSGRLQGWDKLFVKGGEKSKSFNVRTLLNRFNKKPKEAYKMLEEVEFVYKNTQFKKMFTDYFQSMKTIDPDSIIVDTIHASKGLEAPCVIIYDNGRISGRADLAEERRVFYVASTRSSNNLSLVTKEDYNPILYKGIKTL